jgi:hypothetical protein
VTVKVTAEKLDAPWVSHGMSARESGVVGERSIRQAARRAALDAQAGHRRERQERDRRIDAFAVVVLLAR